MSAAGTPTVSLAQGVGGLVDLFQDLVAGEHTNGTAPIIARRPVAARGLKFGHLAFQRCQAISESVIRHGLSPLGSLPPPKPLDHDLAAVSHMHSQFVTLQ